MSNAQGVGGERPAGHGVSGKDRQKPPARILVVDDDPDFALATRLSLERRGYRVITAADAEDAQREVVEQRPDLILLDVMMPTGTEGFHFVWNLRQQSDPALRDTPIIVVSAIHRTIDLRLYPDEADQEYAPGEYLPVQAFLDKPVDPRELVHVVETVLAARSRP